MKIVEIIRNVLKSMGRKEIKRQLYTLIFLDLLIGLLTIYAQYSLLGENLFKLSFLENIDLTTAATLTQASLGILPITTIIGIFVVLNSIGIVATFMGTGNLKTKKKIQALGLYVLNYFYAALSFKRLKFLLLLLGGIICIFASRMQILSEAFSSFSFFAGILLILAYAAVVLLNFARLFFSILLFVSQNITIPQAINQSWEMSKSREVEIVIIFVLLGLVPIIIGIAASLVLANIVKPVALATSLIFIPLFVQTFVQSATHALSIYLVSCACAVMAKGK